MKSSRVSLSGACAARAAYSSAFCQQYPICSRMQGLIVDQCQLGNKDLGSLPAALTEHGRAGCRIWQLPNLGEGHRFGGKCGGWLTEWDHFAVRERDRG